MPLTEGFIAKAFLKNLGAKSVGFLGPAFAIGTTAWAAYDVYKAIFGGPEGQLSPEQQQYSDAQHAEVDKATAMRTADLDRQDRKRQNDRKVGQGAALAAGALDAEEQSGLGTMNALGNSGNIVGSGQPFMDTDASLSRAQALQMSGEVAPHWSQMYGIT